MIGFTSSVASAKESAALTSPSSQPGKAQNLIRENDKRGNDKLNILLVSGTRPEIIKLAPVYHALSRAEWANVSWLHTAQHGEMARQILNSFGICPDMTLTRPGTSLLDFSLACRAQLDHDRAALVTRDRAGRHGKYLSRRFGCVLQPRTTGPR